MVMRGDSCSRGRGFESQRQIPGHFFTIILTYVVKLYCLFQKTENKRKRGRRCSLGQKPRFLSDFKGTNYNREAVIRLFEGLLRSIEIIFSFLMQIAAPFCCCDLFEINLPATSTCCKICVALD